MLEETTAGVRTTYTIGDDIIAQSDFARKRVWLNSTACPVLQRTSTIVPVVSALISFMTFIASMMQTMVSGATLSPTAIYGFESGFAAE